MPHSRPLLIAVVLATWAAACLVAAPQPATPASRPAPSTRPADLSLPDVTGADRRPLDPGAGLASVVFFLAHDCPISNGYAPEINRITAQYAAGGKLAFAVVYPYADLPAAEARGTAREYGFAAPAFVDAGRAVTRVVGPRVTPEAAVVAPDGRVLYRGRIDDRWAGYGKSRPEPTTRDLRDALDAVLAGKPVPTSRTDAVGCPI